MFFVGSYSVVLLARGVLTPQPIARRSSPAKCTHRARTAQIQSFQRLALLARELSTALRTDCVDNLPVLHGGWHRQCGVENAHKRDILFISFINQEMTMTKSSTRKPTNKAFPFPTTASGHATAPDKRATAPPAEAGD